MPLARKASLPGISELVEKMKGGANALTAEVVEAMTTNETFFFRDKIPFEHFKEAVLPALIQARAARKSLRIWCAASSTGPNRSDSLRPAWRLRPTIAAAA